jgi:site-specific recombinase XerD
MSYPGKWRFGGVVDVSNGETREADETPESLSFLQDRWLDAKRAGRGIADNTEKTYREALAGWARELADVHGIAVPEGADPRDRLQAVHLTGESLLMCAAAFHRLGLSARTRAVRISAMRGLCRWLVKTRRLPLDPTIDLEIPRIPERLPVALTDEQLGEVVRAASAPRPGAWSQWVLLDRALLAVFAGAGPRTAEVCGLTAADLVRDVNGCLLRLHGKGAADRNVPIDDIAVDGVDDYLADRAHRFGTVEPGDPLFIALNGSPITSGMIEYRVDLWFRWAGVPRPHGELAHVFRHTFAVGVLRNGGGLNELQAVLGHKNLATTSLYTKVAAQTARDLAKISPVLAHLRATRFEFPGDASQEPR